MKKIILILLLTASGVYSQITADSMLNYALTYRGLSRNDVTIPIEFFSAAEKSPTNDSKLILPLVKDVMVNPLSSMKLLDEFSTLSSNSLIPAVEKLFNYISYPQYIPESRGIPSQMEGIIIEIIKEVKKARTDEEKLLSVYSNDELKFLEKNLMSIIEEEDADDPSNVDIFKFNKARDSSIAVSRRTMDLLNRLDRKLISNSSMRELSFCYELYSLLKSGKFDEGTEEISNGKVTGDFVYYYDEGGITIAIGGKGRNIYKGRFDFIIDAGGDDFYSFDNGKEFKNNFSCIIDLGGNDFYSSQSPYSIGGSVFSSSFIFDKSGDDIYKGTDVSVASAIGGAGIIYDETGNDNYYGRSFSTAAASFGIGLIYDKEGNDTYSANSYSQGFGMTEGIGAIIDIKGNDSYMIDARDLDIGRYNDHFVSMCQGYGLGLRPFYAGGIGLIIEGEGNDIYNTDIFGQGGAYWYSLGAIVDKSGHDKYAGYQYSQGAGIHLAVGLLKDYDGWDFYTSNGVSQGCGHDFGFGLLWDVKGNDNYSAYSLSQGAGNANGIGILIDESGTDGYLSKDKVNTRGYGNSRREYGSIGVFIDGSGDDYYSLADRKIFAPDSSFINSSMWGVFADFSNTDLPEQQSGNDFKVEVDSVNRPHDAKFSTDEYFMMAKTIEPRFSKYQSFGFRKLVEDSINSVNFILTHLSTNDHRETLVMRDFARKVPGYITNALSLKLKEYAQHPSDVQNQENKLTPNEAALACYIIGETGNPSAKEVLLELTYVTELKVRSAALNALGKIRIENDLEFTKKVSSRLTELANEKRTEKLYNKDIVFAFKNYKLEQNIPALMTMLENPYYGARFTAIEALQNFGDKYGKYINSTENILLNNNLYYYAVINSFLKISINDFKTVIESLSKYADSDIRKKMFYDLLDMRKQNSKDETEIKWLGEAKAGL